MNTHEALILAIKAMEQFPPPVNARMTKAIEVLRMICAQRGCEHFDPAVEDGQLTDLIDLIVFG